MGGERREEWKGIGDTPHLVQEGHKGATFAPALPCTCVWGFNSNSAAAGVHKQSTSRTFQSVELPQLVQNWEDQRFGMSWIEIIYEHQQLRYCSITLPSLALPSNEPAPNHVQNLLVAKLYRLTCNGDKGVGFKINYCIWALKKIWLTLLLQEVTTWREGGRGGKVWLVTWC